jgi:polar amino acid transport system substrate-binding protein
MSPQLLSGKVARTAVVAVMAVSTMAVTSCTSGSSSSNGSSSGSDTLAKILQTHVLSVATEQGIPGYEYIGSDGKPHGFDIDIINNIAASLGAKAKFTYVNNAARIGALQAGKVDMVVANFTITPERASVITFSNPYISERSQLAVKTSSAHNAVGDINQSSTRVCLEQGGYAPAVITTTFPKITKFLTLNNISDCVAALQAGKVDAMAQDGFDLGGLLKAHPGSIRIIPDSYFVTELEGIGLPNNDPRWLNWLNLWVSNFINTGLEAQLFANNFGFPLPTYATSIQG